MPGPLLRGTDDCDFADAAGALDGIGSISLRETSHSSELHSTTQSNGRSGFEDLMPRERSNTQASGGVQGREGYRRPGAGREADGDRGVQCEPWLLKCAREFDQGCVVWVYVCTRWRPEQP